ncbi:MAG: ester cyclase [Cytophagaceae bacterium]|nr:MAG: ester cyclase [Cytophagaceae bacterium]
MSIANNKVIMNRFLEFINSASDSLAHELISPNAIFYVPGRPEPLRGPSGYLSLLGMMRGGFPDIQWLLDDMVTEGDTVAARFTMRGTHQGNFMGIPPTGKPIQVQAMNFYRLADRQFIEEYGQPDMLGLLQQIGAAPSA